jgi:minor extracellular serine protease Vpr
LCVLRRLIALVVLLAALLLALPAAAALDLRPIRRAQGEVTQPLVRAGVPYVPAGHATGRVRVLVTLPAAPLAAWSGRELQGRTRAKLNLRAASSQRYRARLAAGQRRAIAKVERAIPAATVGHRYSLLLNGFSLELPHRQLPRLLRLGIAKRVAPDVRHTLATNRSPDVIRAASFSTLHGLRGEGLKIGIVDDGVDARNPFLAGTGFDYPAGFPKGGRPWVNGKIIVARTFPGPNSGRQGRQAFVPLISFHGTHVAGIAAGNAGTAAPPGVDHPATRGLSGVAPRAWIGNYRVFNEPTPIGYVANSAEIAAAFEAAVQDGMDVVNFSGGGPMGDPAADPLLEAVSNMAKAGVIPVISAGNDRDEFGFGTAGSPGVAQEAISVAATSDDHVFAPALRVTSADAPASLREIPFISVFGPPSGWGTADQRLVDVGTIMGTDGRPVDRKLCGLVNDVNDTRSNPLPPGSLTGSIALASRGVCAFVAKAERARAAGAVGLILVDNRFGEANAIPLELQLPAGMVSDLDGERLRAYMAEKGGRTTIRVPRDVREIVTGRSGVITSFSSAAPTNFGHLLKPDVAAPGGQILSSTSPESAGNGTPFAVFDGTSMSAPHVSGAAALLLQAHPTWTPGQMRSALVSTAVPAWGDTARTQEAPVTLQGGGLVDVSRADEPLIFTNPVSLSFGDLNVNRAGMSAGLVSSIADASGGAGEWGVSIRPQAATAGASITADPVVTIAPGGEDALKVVVRATASARAGDNFGFVVLTRGDETRKIPYYFAVTRPGLETKPPLPLRAFQEGDTSDGLSHANVYRFPSWPFGPPPDYRSGLPMNEDGAEDLYTTLLDEPVVNFGASIWRNSANSFSHPWLLGSPDENDVQGQAGIPVNVNNYTFGFGAEVGAAAIVFPRTKRYWISVDAGRDIFTNERLAGGYLLHSWVNDVYPPVVRLITTRVSTGRPLIVARVVDFPARGGDSGIDPASLVMAYQRALVGASAYDPSSGVVVFGLPAQAPAIPARKLSATITAADFQEAKNLSTPRGAILPNTTFRQVSIRGVSGPAASWVTPETNACVARRRQELVVVASSTARVRNVTFLADGKRVARRRGTTAELYSAAWQTGRANSGKHRLSAIVRDVRGRTYRTNRVVRVCR